MRKFIKIIGFAAAGMMLAVMAAGCQGSGKGSLNETVSIPQLSWGNNRCKWR